ncbi:lantibiotic dehydratase family protein [Nostoc sp. PCC 7524]|uniref:lantibiotic dehydratase n=1 Tax=Nostoc sp. (strain ATCC 29411 / PCC 7524) TaxID=28072 RepID=UPI00029ECDA6|nr:lantibiotic dehydratase [Nostoc sp. PCC 7524]AFY47694.1 lantibiotic dehydratase family protein [Nostoc sp. PCC 7524]
MLQICNLPEQLTILPHQIALSGSDWTLWRSVCLRGAGFPTDWLLSLEISTCNALAEELLQLQQKVAQARLMAIRSLADEYAKLDRVEQRRLGKVLQHLRQNQIPDFDHHAVNHLQSAWLEMVNTQTRLNAALSNAWEQNYRQLQTIFAEPQLQTALLWQNPVFARHIQSLLEKPVSTLKSSVWQNILTLARYLQRYCAKNESIGFFGPVGWGRLTTTETAIEFTPGSELLAHRQVYLEGWAINALAQTLSQDLCLRPWLAPSRLPNVELQGDKLYLPAIAALVRQGKLPATVPSLIPLSPAQIQILQLCDGQQTALSIAHHLRQNSAEMFADETTVYTQIEKLCQLGALRWTLEVPMSQHPEKLLREKLSQIGDRNLQASALATLDALETARDQVILAADDPERLNQALVNLEATFTKFTNQAPTRAAGKTYAGRTIVYEDCRRDIKLTLGTDFLEKLGSPLDLLLTSTRWYTHQIAHNYQAVFEEIYEELKSKFGNAEVDFYSFSLQALPWLRDDHNPAITSVRTSLQKFWSEILSVPPEQRQVNYRAAELKSAVDHAFTAPHPGWELARYRSPDIMIAADSVTAINQGDYQLILGELHLFNTLSRAVFVASHPHPNELLTARTQDIPVPTLTPLPSTNWNTQRFSMDLVAPQDIRFAYEAGHSGVPDAQTVTMAELVVVKTAAGLQIQTSDQRFCLPIIEFFGHNLSNLCISFPSILPPANHTPRITIDQLVVVRETWRLQLQNLSFAHHKDHSDNFLAICQMVKDYELPRFVFVKVPGEVKPYYIDFNSPIYCDLLAKIARQAAKAYPEHELCFTEMLPNFDQIWLTDTTEQRYTSELRLVALDPKSPTANY